MSLHFKCSPLDLDEEQVLDYLHLLKSQHKTPSDSFFKHTVYGLRYAYRISGMKAIRVMLPSIERPKKLPVVLSRSGIQKEITTNSLRHSYATHLLEMGLDIISVKDLLGHADIQTTLTYLHVAQLGRQKPFSPLDRLYKE